MSSRSSKVVTGPPSHADDSGVAVDISHVSTASVVKGYSRDDDGLKQALEGADVVVIPAVRLPVAGSSDRNAGQVKGTSASLTSQASRASPA